MSTHGPHERLKPVKSMADGTELARLTCKHREVLDRLLDHKTTKEIARELGVSPNTVDQRLNAAKKVLGTSARSETAVVYRYLVELCGKTTYEDSQLTKHPNPIDNRLRNADPAVFSLADAGFAPTPPWAEQRALVPRVLEGRNGSYLRIAYIVAAALGLLLVLLVGLSVMETLNGLFRA